MQAIDLSSFDLLSVSGSDAKKFLQGQVTCDLNQLSPAHSLTGALCNLKGRVICSFRLVEYNDACYLLLPAGMAGIVKSVLDKYIVFFKAQCLLADNIMSRTGLIGEPEEVLGVNGVTGVPREDNEVVVYEGALLLKIPGEVPRYELWKFATPEGTFPEGPATPATTGSTAAWELEDIKAGVIHVTPELSEQHLPEALNYDLSGVINFKKGCYTGQEIIARMYYRGTAKKRLFYGFSSWPVGGAEPATHPRTVYCLLAETEPAVEGELLRIMPGDNGGWHLLAILPVSATDASSQVFLDQDRRYPVELRSLPERVR